MLTRLAPSPTGALHLGNARTFLVNWAMARQRGWRVLLRIEDLDGPRVKAGAAEAAIDTLAWLGLDWDEGPVYQSAEFTTPAWRGVYREALEALVSAGDAYPCRRTRSEILAASRSAPHAGEHELRYSMELRPADAGVAGAVDLALLDDATVAWRLVTPDCSVTFKDDLLGPQTFYPQREVGDFLIATKGGASGAAQPSYQLAVVVDDARQGVTHVVRGDDLLPSTARQLLLYDLLGQVGFLDDARPPAYTHLPIVVGADGRRLAKRHGDTRIDTYRAADVPPKRVIGLLAEWSGLGTRREMTAAEFAAGFDLAGLPRERVAFGEFDDKWLRAESPYEG
ncbi:MAG: glutamate--tRNA ligase family protein [Planctomycetota bacterium]